MRTLLLLALAAAGPGTTVVTGRVAAVNADALLIRQADGTAIALHLQPGYTHLLLDGQPARPAELVPGESVTATWVDGYGQPVAREVTASAGRQKF